MKRGLNACASSVVPDKPVRSAQANKVQLFPLLLYFSFEGRLFVTKIQFKRKMSSLISLCGLHRLIWDNTLCTCIKPPFHRASLIYTDNVAGKISYPLWTPSSVLMSARKLESVITLLESTQNTGKNSLVDA